MMKLSTDGEQQVIVWLYQTQQSELRRKNPCKLERKKPDTQFIHYINRYNLNHDTTGYVQKFVSVSIESVFFLS